MVLLQYQDRHFGSRCPEDAKIFPTPPTNPSARARGHLPGLNSTSPPRQEVPSNQSAGPEAGHVPGDAPGEKWRKTSFELPSPSHRSGGLPILSAADAKSTSSDLPKPDDLGILSAPGPRGPGGPLGMSGSKRGLFWRPGGHRMTQDQGASPSCGPAFDQALAAPQDRTPSRPSPRCRKAGEPACDPTGDPQTRTGSPSQAQWPGLKRRPLFRPGGEGTFTGKGPAMDPPSRNPGADRPVPATPASGALALGLVHTALKAARELVPESAGPRQRPRVCRPEKAAQTLHTEDSGGTWRPASACALPRGGRGPWRLGPQRGGDSPVKRAPSPGSCRPAPDP